MRPSGKINVIALVLIAGAVAGGWYAYIFAPIYIDNFDVKEKVGKAFLRGGWEGPDSVRTALINNLAQLRFGTHQVYDGSTGEWKETEGLGIPDENVVVVDDPARKLFSVTVTYERTVVLWPTKKTRVVKFVVERKGPYNQ